MSTALHKILVAWVHRLRNRGLECNFLELKIGAQHGDSDFALLEAPEEAAYRFACDVLRACAQHSSLKQEDLISFRDIMFLAIRRFPRDTFEGLKGLATAVLLSAGEIHCRELAQKTIERWGRKNQLSRLVETIATRIEQPLLTHDAPTEATLLRLAHGSGGKHCDIETAISIMSCSWMTSETRMQTAHVFPLHDGQLVCEAVALGIASLCICGFSDWEVRRKLTSFHVTMYTPWDPEFLPPVLTNEDDKPIGLDLAIEIMTFHNLRQLGRWALLFALHFHNTPAYVVLEIVRHSGFLVDQSVEKRFVNFTQSCINSVANIFAQRQTAVTKQSSPTGNTGVLE